MYDYDVIILGGGPGGYKAAEKLSEFGIKTAIVELNAKSIGGTCLNYGCIPVKTLIRESAIRKKEKSADKLIDIKTKLYSNIDIIRKGLIFYLTKTNIDLIYGKGELIDREHIRVRSTPKRIYSAKKIIIATGSLPVVPLNLIPDHKHIFYSKEFLYIDKIPENLLIVGGGVIGIEFASIYFNLGAKITIVEMAPQILPYEDKDAVRTLVREYKKKGIRILTEHRIELVKSNSHSQKVDVKILDIKKNKFLNESFNKVLVAIGRKPAIEGISLNKIGIEFSEKGIKIDSSMKTNIPNIFAIGDITGRIMLAHTAYHQGIIAAYTIIREMQGYSEKTDKKKALFLEKSIGTLNYDNIPRIVFSEPEIASVGICKENEDIASVKSFFRANAKAIIEERTSGFVKIFYKKKDNIIIGGVIVGSMATELIHQISIAISGNLTLQELLFTVFGHPTISETIWETVF